MRDFMKFKRSERIVYMTSYLLSHPNELVPLTYFVEKFGQAKSSISEDVQIIKDTFEKEEIGIITTTAGASGGVTFRHRMYYDEAEGLIRHCVICCRRKKGCFLEVIYLCRMLLVIRDCLDKWEN
ncbi:truncated pur operon repressor [Macrococcoides caseolyticum JCSC5402]|uniref:Truncated pur operon repressor n=1 Tax=Macrococcus caseolyticus (strain JCSC5402) TaxID=458233 RepID=B9E8V6_MACCJ|nr:truncated pur operon repressor [Macrococcus caseolyticus JCSC5402]